MKRFPLSILVVLSFLAGAALGQSPNGTISGLVVDSSGSAISGADVLIMSDATSVKSRTLTNGEGIYTFSNLSPGPYRIQVSRVGFKTLIKPDVILNVQAAVAINFTLPVGAVAETVTVEGGAPLVNTQDSSVNTVVDRRFVENLPLNGRSFQTLIMLTPGVTLTPTTYSSEGQFSVNGQRTDANYFTVDGVSANVGIASGNGLTQSAAGALPGFSVQGGTNSLVSVDALQEFRVQTSSFAPQFGRSPGGQVSIVTRSGTDKFHGTAFDYLRNDVLDANDWFNGVVNPPVPKPKDRQNDFGGVFGGPLIKDKTFFFWSYEGLRLRQPKTAQILVPDIESRNTAPAAVQPYLNAFPLPNGPTLTDSLAQFASGYSDPSSLDSYAIRLDQIILPKLTLFGRYNYSPSSSEQRLTTSLSSLEINSFASHTLTLGLTANLTPDISNELRLNYSNFRASSGAQIDDFGGATPLPPGLFLPPQFSEFNGNIAVLIFGAGSAAAGEGDLLAGKTAANEQRQINVIDNLSYSKGSHQIKMGVDYRWLSPIAGNAAYGQSILFVGVAGDEGSAMSGEPLETDISTFQPDVTLLTKNLSIYGQDTWKISPRLTMTYGLRWDLDPPLRGKNSDSDLFTVVNLNDPANLALAPRGTPLYKTTYTNFAPRLGFGFRLRGDQNWESVLKGGFGLFYDFSSGRIGDATFFFPFTARKSLSGIPLPLTPDEAAPPSISATLPTRSSLFVTDPHLAAPRTYQWNVAEEQGLGTDQSVSVTYVGSIGRKLLRDDSFTRPNTNFRGVIVTRNSATSDYHALQLKYQRRLSRGLQALASYTWSHSIDISSDDTFLTSTPGAVANPSIDRGDSDFDVRHSVTAAISYDLPTRSTNRFSRAMLHNWSIDNFVLARSALPVNIIATTSVFDHTAYSARPNLVPGQPLYLRGSGCAQFFQATGALGPGQPCPGGFGFNPGAFVAPSTGSQGTLGRNVLRGFGAWQDDFTIRRQFAIGDKVKLQFRAEFFNIFNHPNFGAPGNTMISELFGLSTQSLASSLSTGAGNGGLSPLYQVGGPRSIQLALKLNF